MNGARTGRVGNGIALLEVLLSVSILALGMGAAFRSLGTCARTQSRLEERETGRRLAEQQLADLTLRGSAGGEAESGGRFEKPFESFTWTLRAHDGTENFPFRLMELAVWRDSGQQPRQVYATRMIAW